MLAGPWYLSHLPTPPAWGLTPLDDQQIAGLVMWIPGSLAYLAAAWIFVRWIRTADTGRNSSSLPSLHGSV